MLTRSVFTKVREKLPADPTESGERVRDFILFRRGDISSIFISNIFRTSTVISSDGSRIDCIFSNNNIVILTVKITFVEIYDS